MISRTSLGDAYPLKRLCEVADFLDYRRRPVTESDRREGPYPYYGANGQQGTIDNFIFDEPLILLAEDGGHFGEPERGIAYRILGKTWVNNHAHVLRPKAGIELPYLHRVLENYDVRQFVTGTTRGKLTKAGASEILVPIPPPPEQRRIAEVLDRTEALRAKRRAGLNEFEALTKAIFISDFGDPVSNPKGWRTLRLENISKKITDGTHKTPVYVDSGVEFLSAKDLKDQRVKWNSGKFISKIEHIELVKRCNPELGDLLLAKSGSLGSVAVIDRARTFSLFESLCLIKHDRDQIDGQFLAAVLRSPTMLGRLLEKTKGVAIKHLHLVDIRGLSVPVPPLERQLAFAEKVVAVEKLKALQLCSLTELNQLFASLQSRAFSGGL